MEKDYKQKVIEKYADGREVGRAEKQGVYNMEFHYTQKALDEYIQQDKRVIELGCGGGYYMMHYAPRCKEYMGMDLSPVNVEITKQEIEKNNLTNAIVQQGDATDMPQIPDESYDVVLCLGPMYHLNREDRKKCMAECKRICKKDGIIVFAFINKAGAITKFGHGCGYPHVLTPKVAECVIELGTDDKYKDIFYYTMPEEMLEDATAAGLEKIRMTGVDFLVLEEEVDSFTEEERRIWFKLGDLIAGSEYATGLCNHALYICRKV